MAFQVRVRINKNTVNVLSVASSTEEFENFTIGKLKEKALSLFPGVNGRLKLSFTISTIIDIRIKIFFFIFFFYQFAVPKFCFHFLVRYRKTEGDIWSK